MKNFLILLLNLTLILGVFSSCAPKRYLYIDDKSDTSKDMSESEDTTLGETTFEETSSEETRLRPNYSLEPIVCDFSSYEEFVSAMTNPTDEEIKIFESMCYSVPDIEKMLNILKNPQNIARPFINGEPMSIDCVEFGYTGSYIGITYLQYSQESLLRRVGICYVDELLNADFTGYSASQIYEKYSPYYYDDEWTKHTIKIDGATVEAIEQKKSETRTILFYHNGLLIHIIATNNLSMTDEFLQSFSIG